MKATSWKTFHLYAMFTWIVLGIPTILWWSTSILWVLVISLYANVVGHFGAWQAARAEDESATNPPQEDE